MAKLTILRAEVSTEELTAMARVALEVQAVPAPTAREPMPALPDLSGNVAVVVRETPIPPEKPKRRSPTKAPKPQLDKRVCDQCGNLYQPRLGNQRFCSIECNKNWHNAHPSTKKNSTPV